MRRENGEPSLLMRPVLCRFNEQFHYDTTPLPGSVPKVEEVGASSAPLLSASFFIGARCRDYNDDYMQCKTEANGKGEFDCMKEGRRVTRCAQSVYVPLCASSSDGRAEHTCVAKKLCDLDVWGFRSPLTFGANRIKDLNTHCLESFRAHWDCLENRNHQLYQCRPQEWKLNKCVFDKLVGHLLYSWSARLISGQHPAPDA